MALRPEIGATTGYPPPGPIYFKGGALFVCSSTIWGFSHPQPRFNLNSPGRVAGCRCRHLVASQAHAQAPAPLPSATLPEALRGRLRHVTRLFSTSCPKRPKTAPISSLRASIALSSQCTACKSEAARLGIASILHGHACLTRHHIATGGPHPKKSKPGIPASVSRTS